MAVEALDQQVAGAVAAVADGEAIAGRGQMAAGQTAKTVISEDRTKLLLGNRVLLDADKDGFMSIKLAKPAPGGKRFAIIACDTTRLRKGAKRRSNPFFFARQTAYAAFACT